MRFGKVAVVLVLLCAGCKARDGDLLVQVCRKAGEKVQALAGQAPERLGARLRGTVGEASVAARVHNRIRWDRYLARLDVDVQVPSPGAVVLSGAVPDLSIKQRVLDLAKSTTGVNTVEDRLRLPKEKGEDQ
jgi:osmotically-inducible protein OsmY